jgi:hypothetical protein
MAMSADRNEWLTEFDLVALLQASCSDSSRRTVARRCGVSEQYLSKVLNLQAPPGTAIPETLGFEAVTLYRPIDEERE